MDPLSSLNRIQEAYRSYVFTFQKIKNPAIRDWISEKISKGQLLWKDPYIQLNRQFQKGDSLSKLVEDGIIHRKFYSCKYESTSIGFSKYDGRYPAK